jgi:hypothetical protein
MPPLHRLKQPMQLLELLTVLLPALLVMLDTTVQSQLLSIKSNVDSVTTHQQTLLNASNVELVICATAQPLCLKLTMSRALNALLVVTALVDLLLPLLAPLDSTAQLEPPTRWSAHKESTCQLEPTRSRLTIALMFHKDTTST